MTPNYSKWFKKKPKQIVKHFKRAQPIALPLSVSLAHKMFCLFNISLLGFFAHWEELLLSVGMFCFKNQLNRYFMCEIVCEEQVWGETVRCFKICRQSFFFTQFLLKLVKGANQQRVGLLFIVFELIFREQSHPFPFSSQKGEIQSHPRQFWT